MKAIFRSGIPVMGKNYFPSNIQGLPTWYEIRVTRDGYAARAGRVDIMVAMNAETYARDVQEVAPGGYLHLRLDLAARALLQRERHHGPRRAAGAAVQRELQRRAHPHPDEEHLLRRRAGGAARPGSARCIRGCSPRPTRKKPQLVDSNMKAIQLGYDYASEHFSCPLPLRVEKMDRTARPHHDRRQHRRGARLRVRRRDGRRLVSDHALHLAHGRLQGVLRPLRVDKETGERNFAFIQAEDELAAIGMVIGAIWNGARAFTADRGPGHLADERVPGARLLRRGARR